MVFATFAIPLALTISSFTSYAPAYLDYAFFALILNHIIQLGMFQVYIFVQGTQNRLELLLHALRALKKKKSVKLLVDFQECFIQLSETNRKQNHWCKSYLLISLVYTYTTIADTLYWLILGSFKEYYLVVLGELNR